MIWKYLLVWILCSVTFTTIISQIRNESKFKRLNCIIGDNDLITNHSCRTKLISRNRTIFNLNFFFSYPVDPIVVNIRLYKKLNVIYRPFLVNATENFCKMFARKSSTPYMLIVLKMVEQYTNVNHSCPYQGWILFKDVVLDLSKMSVAWPGGDYRLDLDIFYNNRKVKGLTVQSFVEIRENTFF